MRDTGFRAVTRNEAVYACTHTREFYSESVEQIPNATFQRDRDGNGRPDGWLGCDCPPEGIQAEGKHAIAIVDGSARTTIYGPEPGSNRLSLSARSTGEKPSRATLTVRAVMVGDDFIDRPEMQLVQQTRVVGKDWEVITAQVDVGRRTDRLTIRISSAPTSVLLAEPSFRRLAE